MISFGSLCLLLPLAMLMGSAASGDRGSIKIPKVTYRSGIYTLVLDGQSAYARGFQHGKALSFAIKLGLRNFKRWIQASTGIVDSEQMLQEFISKTGYLQSAQGHAPDLVEEMQGIAAGAGVDLQELFCYQSFDELTLYLLQTGMLTLAADHCTCTGLYGRQGKPNLLSHNNDMPTYHEGLGTVLHIRVPDSDLEILQGTFAGQIGQNGVNNRGLAVGMNTILDLPLSEEGVPASFHVRRLLECEDRHAAIAYLKTQSFGTAMNYIIGDREKIVTVETWEDNVVVLDHFPDQIVAHTNHTLQQDAPVTIDVQAGEGGPSLALTHERLDLALDALTADPEGMMLEDLIQLKRTAPILYQSDDPPARTLMSMIVEIPREGDPLMYTTPDSPDGCEHVKFEF